MATADEERSEHMSWLKRSAKVTEPPPLDEEMMKLSRAHVQELMLGSVRAAELDAMTDDPFLMAHATSGFNTAPDFVRERLTFGQFVVIYAFAYDQGRAVQELRDRADG